MVPAPCAPPSSSPTVSYLPVHLGTFVRIKNAYLFKWPLKDGRVIVNVEQVLIVPHCCKREELLIGIGALGVLPWFGYPVYQEALWFSESHHHLVWKKASDVPVCSSMKPRAATQGLLIPNPSVFAPTKVLVYWSPWSPSLVTLSVSSPILATNWGNLRPAFETLKLSIPWSDLRKLSTRRCILRWADVGALPSLAMSVEALVILFGVAAFLVAGAFGVRSCSSRAE